VAAFFGAAFLVPAIASADAPDGKNRKVLVENVSNHALRELYASPSTSTTWEENLLANRTVESGKSISANIDNGTNECYYDLKGVMDDGRAVEHRTVNVCAASKWVIGETTDTVE
jgi:hypothetical protein